MLVIGVRWLLKGIFLLGGTGVGIGLLANMFLSNSTAAPSAGNVEIAWDAFHAAVVSEEVETALVALSLLQHGPQNCTVALAIDLQKVLRQEEEKGFRHVNPKKQHYIEKTGCYLPLIDFDASPLPSAGAAYLQDTTASIRRAWERLHRAVTVWDLESSRSALAILTSSTDKCIRSFARDLALELDQVEGLRQINPKKQHYIDRFDCQLPLIDYSFSPIVYPLANQLRSGGGFETSIDGGARGALWQQLHTAIAVWDLAAAQKTLTDLAASEYKCDRTFADDFAVHLQVDGVEGFRRVTALQQEINRTMKCDLPLREYDFSPVSEPIKLVDLPGRLHFFHTVNDPVGRSQDVALLMNKEQRRAIAWIENPRTTSCSRWRFLPDGMAVAESTNWDVLPNLRGPHVDEGILYELYPLPVEAFPGDVAAAVSTCQGMLAEADLHQAALKWDMQTAGRALETLRQSEDACMVSFAEDFAALLEQRGTEGFRGITPLKRAYNARPGCDLRVDEYEFSP